MKFGAIKYHGYTYKCTVLIAILFEEAFKYGDGAKY
jgi:hypothetical protein